MSVAYRSVKDGYAPNTERHGSTSLRPFAPTATDTNVRKVLSTGVPEACAGCTHNLAGDSLPNNGALNRCRGI
jgi:hypothetical protein